MNVENIAKIMQFDYNKSKILFAVNKTFRNYLYNGSEKAYKKALSTLLLTTGKSIAKYTEEISMVAKTDAQIVYRVHLVADFLKMYLKA